jgi:hypothetical protein
MGMLSEPSDVVGALVSGQAMEVGADEVEVEYRNGNEEACGLKGGMGFGIASLRSSSP